jgi:hypothetical protein
MVVRVEDGRDPAKNACGNHRKIQAPQKTGPRRPSSLPESQRMIRQQSGAAYPRKKIIVQLIESIWPNPPLQNFLGGSWEKLRQLHSEKQ